MRKLLFDYSTSQPLSQKNRHPSHPYWLQPVSEGLSVPVHKINAGYCFEDFRLGQVLVHPTPRTVTRADAVLYSAIYGSRFALQSSDVFSQDLGYPESPLDDWLVFHLIFGKTVPDISLNAIANLGYAEAVFLKPVYPGATLTATSEVIGLKESSSGDTGVVYVRSTGFDQTGEAVLSYCRWVLVRKRDAKAPAPQEHVPTLSKVVPVEQLVPFYPLHDGRSINLALSGSPYLWEDYEKGERLDHVCGMTVEEAEHQIATRLYQNTATVHFDQHAAKDNRFGRRLIYGGHVISLARALSFNGLANAFHIAAINSGRHVAPLFAGDTVFAWSEILEAAALPYRPDVGALRIRTVATKNRRCSEYPDQQEKGYHPSVVLDLDYWALMPRR